MKKKLKVYQQQVLNLNEDIHKHDYRLEALELNTKHSMINQGNLQEDIDNLKKRQDKIVNLLICVTFVTLVLILVLIFIV